MRYTYLNNTPSLSRKKRPFESLSIGSDPVKIPYSFEFGWLVRVFKVVVYITPPTFRSITGGNSDDACVIFGWR